MDFLQSSYLWMAGARSFQIGMWPQGLHSRSREGWRAAQAVRSQAQWRMLDFLLNPTWPEFGHMISSYLQGRRESVPFLHLVEEENESGFGEDSQVSPERPEGIHGESHGVLWKSSRRPEGASGKWTGAGSIEWLSLLATGRQERGSHHPPRAPLPWWAQA